MDAKKKTARNKRESLPCTVQPRCCQEIPENQKGIDDGKI